MNSSQFMDKQIMDLTSSSITTATTQSLGDLGSSPQDINNSSSKDFIDLMKNHHHPPQDNSQAHSNDSNYDIDGIKRDQIVASYDFQPIRPIIDPTASARLRNSATSDSKSNSTTVSPLRNYGSLDSDEPPKVIMDKDPNLFDAAIMSEIDRTMKIYSDNLLHVLEGVSARLTQLESRNRHLENSIDDLKVSVGNNFESNDGKMRQMENILREVQIGVQVLKDKQEMLGAQLQLSQLRVCKTNQLQSETQATGQVDAMQQAASAPPQSHQLPTLTFPQSVPSVPLPHPVPPILQQNLSPPAPLPNQFPQNQIPPVSQQDPYHSSPGQTPPSQQPQSSPAAPSHQPYQHPSQSQYSRPPQLHQSQPPLAHHPEETHFVAPHSYPPKIQQPSTQPPSGAPPSQPYYGAPSHMYEPPTSRPSSGFAAGYGPPSVPAEPYHYGRSSTQYGRNPTVNQQQPTMSQSGGSGYPQLPTARILPQSLPTASSIGSGSGSSGTGNKVPLDDVVDKVTNMGFPREHVRSMVQKLTESGQSVDLNVVLDKLMNDEVQPQRGWFGR